MHLLVLSPHLDDAVLSCGGELAAVAEAGDGGGAHVVTVFAGDPAASASDAEATPVGQAIRRLMGLGPDALSIRREEDERALERLGVSHETWTLFDAADRRSPEGVPEVAQLTELFDTSRPLPDAIVRPVAERFERLRTEHPRARVLAPLGIGGHVDHRLVRQVAEEVWKGADSLRLYEDFPYCRGRRARWRVLGPPLRRRLAKDESRPLAPCHLGAKIEAIAAYSSQLGPLFGSAEAMPRAVEREWRRHGGGEVRWCPSATAGV